MLLPQASRRSSEAMMSNLACQEGELCMSHTSRASCTRCSVIHRGFGDIKTLKFPTIVWEFLSWVRGGGSNASPYRLPRIDIYQVEIPLPVVASLEIHHGGVMYHFESSEMQNDFLVWGVLLLVFRGFCRDFYFRFFVSFFLLVC